MTNVPLVTDPQRQMLHDLRHCLSVIGIGMVVLQQGQTDNRLIELCDSLDAERKKAVQLLRELSESFFDETWLGVVLAYPRDCARQHVARSEVMTARQ